MLTILRNYIQNIVFYSLNCQRNIVPTYRLNRILQNNYLFADHQQRRCRKVVKSENRSNNNNNNNKRVLAAVQQQNIMSINSYWHFNGIRYGWTLYPPEGNIILLYYSSHGVPRSAVVSLWFISRPLYVGTRKVVLITFLTRFNFYVCKCFHKKLVLL